MKTLGLAAWVVLASGSLIAQKTLYDFHAAAFYGRVVLAPRHRLSLPSAERMARRFLGETKNIRFKRLEIFTDRLEAEARRSGMSFDFPSWREDFLRPNWRTAPIAQVIAMGDSAVMKLCHRPGKVTRLVLQGTDVLKFQAGGASCEILDLNALSDKEAHLAVDVKTSGEVRPEQGEAIARALGRTTGVERLLVAIRSDPWFVSGNNFRILYRFEMPSKPPTGEEYCRTPTLFVRFDFGNVSTYFTTDSEYYCRTVLKIPKP